MAFAMANTVTCDKCGNIIEVDRILEEQLRHKIADQERGRLTKEIEEKTASKIREELKLEMVRTREEAEESKIQNKKLQEQLGALIEELRKTKREKEEVELEAKKKLLNEEEKIRGEVRKKAEEDHRLKEMEMQKQLQDALKTNDEMRRKLEQGSQQTQGEVQELDLENVLRTAFPGDLVEPVGKGINGADIAQGVKSPRGISCGTILWESKRTKSWSDGWVTKLRQDMIAAKADIAAIVSEVLPDQLSSGIGNMGEVWICLPKFALILGQLLRKSLLDAARQRVISENKQSKAEYLYSYVTGTDFVNTVSSMVETYKEMLEQIDRERMAYEKSWKLREGQVRKLMTGVSGIYGSIQGVAGPSLPQIESLELEGPRAEQLNLGNLDRDN